jgi:Polyketide cyclase / dehydrase and lipid transport
MKFQHSIEIKASSNDIYQLYKNVGEWSIWDPEVESSNITGEFKTGATGTIKPKGGPQSTLYFTDIKPNISVTTQCKLPLCTMTFDHQLSQHGESTTATHSVSFTGFLAPIFGWLIGKSIQRTLPDSMRGLKDAAESKTAC